MQRQTTTTTSKAKALIGKALFAGLILSHNSGVFAGFYNGTANSDYPTGSLAA